MSKLSSYLAQNRIRQADFAEAVASSQSMISKLCSNSVQPSLDLAVRIERATSGAVPASSWIEDSPAPSQEDAA